MNTRPKRNRSDKQSNTLSSNSVSPKFNVITFVRSGARPIYRNGHWNMERPVYEFDIQACDTTGGEGSTKDRDTEGEIKGLYDKMNEIMWFDKEGLFQFHPSVLEQEDAKNSEALERDLKHINSWKTDLNLLDSTSDAFHKYNEGLPERWNNVFSHGLKHLTENKLKPNTIGSIKSLSAMKGEDESEKQSIMLRYGIASEEVQREVLENCLSNVHMPCVWMFAGSRRDVDPVRLREFNAHNSNFTTSSGTIKKDSNLISPFCNTSPDFVIRAFPALDPTKTVSAAKAVGSFYKSVYDEGSKIFVSSGYRDDHVDPIHEINYFDLEAETKEEYAASQYGVISAREKEIRDRLKTISDSVQNSLKSSSDFEVKVLCGRDFDHYKHSLDFRQASKFNNWKFLYPCLETEFENLIEAGGNRAKVTEWFQTDQEASASVVSGESKQQRRQK